MQPLVKVYFMITPREQDDVSEFRDIMIQGEYTGINEDLMEGL